MADEKTADNQETTEPKAVEANAEEQAAPAEEKAPTIGGREILKMESGRGGILGVKAGMTQIYDDEGRAVPVTVLSVPSNIVTDVRTKEKNGYQAVQVGFLERKAPRSKSEAGRTKKANAQGFQYYQEFRLGDDESLDGVTPGKVLALDFIQPGDMVDVTAVSKGKGFQGVMKRHNYAGGPASHGASIVHRMPGSTGQNTSPGRVFKGKKMAGQMGNHKVTVQNLKVVAVDPAKELLVIRGGIPGAKSGVVTVRRAVKA